MSGPAIPSGLERALLGIDLAALVARLLEPYVGGAWGRAVK